MQRRTLLDYLKIFRRGGEECAYVYPKDTGASAELSAVARRLPVCP